MSRDPDDGDDRFDFDFSQAFPRAHRSQRQSADRKPRQQKAKRKFIADNFSPRRSPEEVHKDLAGVGPRVSMERQIKILVAQDLNRSAKSIATELDALGYEAAPLTVSVVREEMMAVLRLCHQYGSITVPAWDED